MYQTCCDSGPDYECYITKSGLDYDRSVTPKKSPYVLAKTLPSLRPDDCPLEEVEEKYIKEEGETIIFEYIDKATDLRQAKRIANTRKAYYETLREIYG
jgi:hypothetical protein